MRPLLTVLLLGLAPSFLACLPSFEDAQCFIASDCTGGLSCVDNVCTLIIEDGGIADTGISDDAATEDTGGFMEDSGLDLPDTGFPDVGAPDAAPLDAAQEEADAGPPPPPDAGLPDAETPDSGQMDAGMIDSGVVDPIVTLSPDPIDVGLVNIGCPPGTQQFTIENMGPTDTIIHALEIGAGTSAEFQWAPPVVPFPLAAGAQVSFDIMYTPNNLGIDTGTLEMRYGVFQNQVNAALQGEGTMTLTRQDSAVQTPGAIDILFVVDNSLIMLGFQSDLAMRVPELFSTLNTEMWDYQIGVTTTDVTATGAAGALVGNPAIITSALADPQATLQARVQVGDNGSFDEQGLEASQLALSPPLATVGANAGFLRTDAALLVIYLSNEDDNSVPLVSSYGAFLEGLKTDPDLVSTNVIVSAVTECFRTGGGNARFAGRYLGIIGQTGGAFSDICALMWTDALTTMPPVPRNTTFPLSTAPMPGTIEVQINGTVVPSNNEANWRYDGPSQSVIFTGVVPEFADQVDFTYQQGC